MDKSSTQEKSSPIVVGLDIGTTKICAIVGRRSKNGKVDSTKVVAPVDSTQLSKDTSLIKH